MSWRDRPYASDFGQQPELRIQFRRPSTAVVWLLIANVVVFFSDTLATRFLGIMTVETSDHLYPMVATHHYLGLSLIGIKSLYFWQPLTYMFMHGGLWHLLMNMLGLYIFGSEFERAFGRDRFLQLYGTCGLVGGLAYVALGALGPERFAVIPVVGASGAIYGLLIAAIIFFPHIRVILIIFPMPIRVFGLIVAGILFLQLLSGNVENPGGEACHIAGAATAIAIFHAWGIMPRIRFGGGGEGASPSFVGRVSGKMRQGSWARKQKRLAEERVEVDRILTKVHEQGLQSLTRGEKKVLSRATRRQQEEDRKLGRADRM
jgi:membrane associated rhomboid family serine protease